MIKPPFNLRCEYLENPIEIDIPNPCFSWVLEHKQRNQLQSAYQIIVSSEENLCRSGVGDLWDTNKVYSKNQVNIKYEGHPLKSNTNYYWRVKWWDKDDSVSSDSELNNFGTALLEKSDWKAKWISNSEFIDINKRKTLQYKSGERGMVGIQKEVYAVYLRKEFSFSKPLKSAKVYVCGLGYYEFRLNGKKVGNRILEPAQTDYNKIALYSCFEITGFLQNQNALGIILGNGRCVELFGYDFPKLILQIHLSFEDGTNETVITDESWKISAGPITENGIYYGEKYDAQLEMPGWDLPNFDESLWKYAAVVNGHDLSSQLMEPIQITQVLKSKKVYSPKQGTYIYDFGQNFTGYVRLKVRGPRGQEIKLRFSEIIYENGTLNTGTNGRAVATDIFVLKGEGEEVFEPHFTYHGFRYVEVTNFPGVPSKDSIEGLFFHSNVEKTGDFFCSNELINKIHSNIIWSQLSNLMSIPTDSPQRDERQGWMGDAQLITEESMLNFNMARFYTKYLRDIMLCQKSDGSISDVVPPYWKLYPADPAWGTAYLTIAWYMYWYYNDIRILDQHYESMKKYVEFLSSIAKEDIITIGKFGDWCPPMCIVSKRTPIDLVSTWYYYHDTLLLSKIAKILGKEDNYEYYSKKALEIKNAFNKRFLKRTYEYIKVSFADRALSQTSNVLPLYLNMVPEKKEKSIINALVEIIKDHYDCHIDTGIVGTRYIFEVLTARGFPEIAYKMITQKSFPGYGYMIREGATTLWERWEKLESSGMNSQNHIMLGSVDTWFYNTLAGIKSLLPGWEKFRIKPFIANDLTFAQASLKVNRGLIYSAWEKNDSQFKLHTTIPVGCKSEVWIPYGNDKDVIYERENIILKKGKLITSQIGIELKTIEDNYAVFNLGSGDFEFTVKSYDVS